MSSDKSVLAVTDDVVLAVSSVMKELGKEGIEGCDPLIITHASTINEFPLDSSSVDVVLAISKTSDFPSDTINGEFSRILKPGGKVFVCKNLEGNSGNGILPKFFTVYLGGESGDHLEIPIAFNRFLPKDLPRSVTVKSIYGKIWKLSLRKCRGGDDKYDLVDGWKRIAKDESLKAGDFLELEFDGLMSFNFCIYEGSTMTKRLKRSSMHSDGQEEEKESGSSDDVVVLDDDDDDDDDYLDDNGSAAEAVDDEDERGYLDDGENPYFTVALNPKRISQLHIPTIVIKDYGLNFSESITVIDPIARTFGKLVKKIKIQSNGSVFIKSFGSIIRRNEVKTTDKMIFELKKSSGSNLVHTIKVHIISG